MNSTRKSLVKNCLTRLYSGILGFLRLRVKHNGTGNDVQVLDQLWFDMPLFSSREGIETSSIQLATKILVDEGTRNFDLCFVMETLSTFVDRIRKTLAHEMCHLACWIIDRNPKEAHGSLFKSW